MSDSLYGPQYFQAHGADTAYNFQQDTSLGIAVDVSTDHPSTEVFPELYPECLPQQNTYDFLAALQYEETFSPQTEYQENAQEFTSAFPSGVYGHQPTYITPSEILAFTESHQPDFNYYNLPPWSTYASSDNSSMHSTDLVDYQQYFDGVHGGFTAQDPLQGSSGLQSFSPVVSNGETSPTYSDSNSTYDTELQSHIFEKPLLPPEASRHPAQTFSESGSDFSSSISGPKSSLFDGSANNQSSAEDTDDEHEVDKPGSTMFIYCDVASGSTMSTSGFSRSLNYLSNSSSSSSSFASGSSQSNHSSSSSISTHSSSSSHSINTSFSSQNYERYPRSYSLYGTTEENERALLSAKTVKALRDTVYDLIHWYKLYTVAPEGSAPEINMGTYNTDKDSLDISEFDPFAYIARAEELGYMCGCGIRSGSARAFRKHVLAHSTLSHFRCCCSRKGNNQLKDYSRIDSMKRHVEPGRKPLRKCAERFPKAKKEDIVFRKICEDYLFSCRDPSSFNVYKDIAIGFVMACRRLVELSTLENLQDLDQEEKTLTKFRKDVMATFDKTRRTVRV